MVVCSDHCRSRASYTSQKVPSVLARYHHQSSYQSILYQTLSFRFYVNLKMLTAKGVRNACPKHVFSSRVLSSRATPKNVPLNRFICIPSAYQHKPLSATTHRSFATSTRLLHSDAASTPDLSYSDIEKVVRDAKQRFRDTLPKDYLNEEEYRLYVRLYGPPLRETEPEDVGIHTHIDLGPELSNLGRDGVVLKELDDGTYEEIAYDLPVRASDAEGEEALGEQAESENKSMHAEELDDALVGVEGSDLVDQAPGYVQAVARNQREADALNKLAENFEKTQRRRREEAAAAERAAEEEIPEDVAASSWPEETELVRIDREYEPTERRFHPHTMAGSFHGSPVEILLPKDELVTPIAGLLRRSHIDHVRKAAETAFGGPGLPLSAEMVLGRKSGHMGGVGLLGDQRHMTEIEADAFIAGFIPPAYASVFSVLREVRRRVGSEWLQSKLRKGGEGLSVLDTGSGGAGLLAWEQVLQAEWELLQEKGQARGPTPPGKKTVIATADRLRHRLKTFLHDTTFLPRMPDYEHSGEMRGPRLEGGDQQQPRKEYDLIIASHLLLREKEDHRRQAVLNNLWHLLKKDGGVLIIIEKAHPRGFEAVAHARDTILNQFLLDEDGNPRVSPEDFNPTFHREPEPGHVIAPCTTQGACPMYPEPGKYIGRKDYCHFSQRFVRPSFYTRMLNKKHDNEGEVEFSYVAVQRGVSRSGKVRGSEATQLAKEGYENSKDEPDMQTLPRLLLPGLKRKGHVTMDVCTPEGQVERWTVPKSFSKLAYHDARKSRWGDLWALGAKTRVARTPRNGKLDGGGKRTAGSEDGRRGTVRKVDIDGDTGTTRVKGGESVTRKRGAKGKMSKQDVLAELRRADQEEEKELDAEIEAELVEMEEEDKRKSGRS